MPDQEQAVGGLGRQVIGATFADDTQMTLDGAKMHRDLAIGNFFVALRGLTITATRFLGVVVDQETRDQA